MAGCCEPLLEIGSSRHYLRNPCIGAWTPTPWFSAGAFARFFPADNGLTLQERRSAPQNYPCNATSAEEDFSGLQSFRNVQAPILTRPPGCSYRCGSVSTGQPGRLHHAYLGWLPAPSCGIATCPTRATDTAGLTPAGLWPRRPLRRDRNTARTSLGGDLKPPRSFDYGVGA